LLLFDPLEVEFKAVPIGIYSIGLDHFTAARYTMYM